MNKPITELYQAVKAEDLKRIKALIQSKVDLDEPSSPIAEHYCQETPLTLAVQKGNLSIVKLLVEAGADVNKLDPPPLKPRTDFHASAGCPVNWAAEYGKVAILEYLLAQGARPTKSAGAAQSPLFSGVTCREAKHLLEVIKLLLEAGAKPVGEEFERTYLSLVVDRKPAEYPVGIVRLLVEHGANVNAPRSLDGARPLHVAISKNSDKAVGELLQCGADLKLPAMPNDRTPWSELSPLAYATKAKAKKCLALLASAVDAKQPSPKAKPTKTTTKTTPPRLLTSEKAWDTLEDILQQDAPKIAKGLLPGATAKDVAQLMKVTHLRLSKEIQEFFLRHNGQSKGPGLIMHPEGDERFLLLSTVQAAKEWSVWNELNEAGEFDHEEIIADEGVREAWWHPKWLPFAGNGLGDFLCFDGGPAKGGTAGQIITVWHESGTRTIAFQGLRELLNSLVLDYRNG